MSDTCKNIVYVKAEKGPMINKNVLNWTLVIAIGVVIYSFSNIPGLKVVQNSWVPLEWMRWIDVYTIKIGTQGWFAYKIAPDPDFIIRKLGHFGLFGLLGFALYRATGSVTWALLISSIFAVSDEVHQYFTGGRHGNVYDMFIDFLGAVFFVWIRYRYLKEYVLNSRERE